MLAGHLPLIVTIENREGGTRKKEKVINVRKHCIHMSVKISPSIIHDLPLKCLMDMLLIALKTQRHFQRTPAVKG